MLKVNGGEHTCVQLDMEGEDRVEPNQNHGLGSTEPLLGALSVSTDMDQRSACHALAGEAQNHLRGARKQRESMRTEGGAR